MDSHSQEHSSNTNSHGSNQQDRIPTEPVRSRWTPKPEQILILESIFNSGMVNPPKDETVRIRKLLEKFGAVGDANVFYWFQNRRSRSRRRQRQIQAGLAAAAAADPRAAAGLPRATSAGSTIYHDQAASSSRSSTTSSSSSSGGAFLPCSSTTTTSSSSSSSFIGDDGADDLFSISRQMGFMDTTQNPMFYPSDVSQLHYQSGLITVFINGMPSEVPRGPIDLRAMFGQDVMLVHSSGELVPVNDYGVLYQGLQMGESYYLVSRTT